MVSSNNFYKTKEMKTKKLTFLLALTFLFLFSGSSVVFADDFQDGVDAYDRKDYKIAHRLFLPLAEQGDASAQFNLGVMYDLGRGVPQGYKEAVRLYRLSAEQEYAVAQYNLGVMYVKGRGVPQDYKESVKWYRLSAKQGNATAQNNLGLMYANGQGVPQDYVSAHMWFNLSGSNGHKNAVENRNLIEKKMTPSQLEEAQRLARNWKPKQKSKGLLGQFKEKFGIK